MNITSIKNPIVKALKKRSVLKRGGQVFEFKNGMVLYKLTEKDSTVSTLYKNNKLFKKTETLRLATSFLPKKYLIKLHTTTNFETKQNMSFSTIIDYGKLSTNPERKKLNISTDICTAPLKGNYDTHKLYIIDNGEIMHNSSLIGKNSNKSTSNNTVPLTQDLLDLYKQHEAKLRSIWDEETAVREKIVNKFNELKKTLDAYIDQKADEAWNYAMERLRGFPFN